MSTNEPAGVGHNLAPDYAQRVTEQMARDYQAQREAVDKAERDAAELLGHTINNDDEMTPFVQAIKRMRDLASRLKAFQEKEKEPHLRGGQAVDGFFFKMIDRIARRERRANPGVADQLQAHVDGYMQRKRAEEEERRRLAQEEADRKARAEREEAERLAREAEEKRQAAERARKPETRQDKAEAAREAEVSASTQNVKVFLADDAARAAEVAAAAKPADMVRTRVAGGGMATMGTETYAEITDAALLDSDKLWPFISVAEKEKALRAWARTTDFREQMDGASIGRRPKTVIR